MEQVFYNILENSIQASFFNYTINVTANGIVKDSRNHLLVKVTDFGCKVSKDLMFSYFYPEKSLYLNYDNLDKGDQLTRKLGVAGLRASHLICDRNRGYVKLLKNTH